MKNNLIKREFSCSIRSRLTNILQVCLHGDGVVEDLSMGGEDEGEDPSQPVVSITIPYILGEDKQRPESVADGDRDNPEDITWTIL